MSKKKILIFVVVISVLFIAIGFGSVAIENWFLERYYEKENAKKNNVKVEPKDIITIELERCDDGYCSDGYTIRRIEDGTFQLEFNIRNTNSEDMKKGCFKFYFSDEDNFVTCYSLFEANDSMVNIQVMEKDIFSKYSDYKLINLKGKELKEHYANYEYGYVVIED